MVLQEIFVGRDLVEDVVDQFHLVLHLLRVGLWLCADRLNFLEEGALLFIFSLIGWCRKSRFWRVALIELLEELLKLADLNLLNYLVKRVSFTLVLDLKLSAQVLLQLAESLLLAFLGKCGWAMCLLSLDRQVIQRLACLFAVLSISLRALGLLRLALGLLHWSLVAGELSVLVFLPASCSLRVGFLVVLLEVKVDVDGVLLVPG